MKLAITICATETYAIALGLQARRIISNINNYKEKIGDISGIIVLIGDKSGLVDRAENFYKQNLPEGFTVIRDSNYKGIDTHDRKSNTDVELQGHLYIAQMRSRAFDIAKQHRVDYTWTLDSDVLPPYNALACMKNMLDFDAGYYDVATCPYPNFEFIGGRGTPEHPICPDVYEDEREIPEALEKELKNLRDEMEKIGHPKNPEEGKQFSEIGEKLHSLDLKVRECKPKANVWGLNEKKWRKRGWLSSAYPAIGKGAVVPADWCGFGCNLMTNKALNIACFDGYDGKGTEDLYCIFHYWIQKDIRISAITHCLCDHVKKNPDKESKDKFVIFQSYHQLDGECVGHLRTRIRPFYNLEAGDPIVTKKLVK